MRRPSLHQSLLFLLSSVGIVLAMAGAAPRLADTVWALELPGHFRAHLSLGAILVTLGFATLRAWRHVAVSAGLAGLIAAPVGLLWMPTAPTHSSEGTLRVLSLNVSLSRGNHAAVRRLIRDARADIVGLVEVDGTWMAELAPLDDLYAYRVVEPRGRPGSGVALLSRVPLETVEIRPLVTSRTLSVVASFNLQGRPVTLGLVHTASPKDGSSARRRNRQLDTLAAIPREFAGREIVLMGDFNTSPWSPAYRRLIAETGLRNAAAGFGYTPTWPAHLPRLGIPIDHFLVSDGLVVREFRTRGPTGSDHLAIYAELGVRRGSKL